MAKTDDKELKKSGFMPQIQKDHYSMRLKIVGGQIQTEQLLKVYEIAKKYGRDYIHMTSRQSIEIPFIRLEDVEIVKKELAKAGLQPGAGGPRIRTITACQGSAVCRSGLIDTTALAKEIDQKYYNREVPHKFKIGITGCRNNCLKAEENDIGIKGGMKPRWIENKCSFCGLCEGICREKSIIVDKQNHKLIFNENNCNFCGRCVKVCPANAWEGQSGFIVFFGGLFGNRIAIGKQLMPIIYSTEMLYNVIDTTLLFFKSYGNQGERFGNTLDRAGWKLLQNELDNLLSKVIS